MNNLNTLTIRRWDNGDVIFSYTCKNNTMRKTVIEAINQNINLSYAFLSGCDLTGINLKDVNLSNADLSYAYLDNITELNTNFTNAKGLNDQCPKEGSFIGWKKCLDAFGGEYIVKLEIPAEAKRSSSTAEKCRCDKAKVLEIQCLDGTIADIDHVFSNYNRFFIYNVGEIVFPDSFDDKFWNECGHGIHFFMNRQDAVDYDFF